MARPLVLLAILLAAGPQEDPLQAALNDLDPEGPWHYNNPASGFAEARATGKPLLVVVRCVV
ncbi:MAG: hypothetical protein HY293_16280 [Planctomycetes bacterium]|nr:hypothetical protein [Planctomycetota bacterium]